MKQILGSLAGGVAALLLREYRRHSIARLKIQAVICYLHGVRAARAGFLAVLRLALHVMLAGCGFLLMHVGFFLLLPQAWRPAVCMGLGAVYLLVAYGALRRMCAEKTWMELSNAGKYVAAATEKPDPRGS